MLRAIGLVFSGLFDTTRGLVGVIMRFLVTFLVVGIIVGLLSGCGAKREKTALEVAYETIEPNLEYMTAETWVTDGNGVVIHFDVMREEGPFVYLEELGVWDNLIAAESVGHYLSGEPHVYTRDGYNVAISYEDELMIVCVDEMREEVYEDLRETGKY